MKDYETHKTYLKQLKKFHDIPVYRKPKYHENFFTSESSKPVSHQTKYYSRSEMKTINQGDLNLKVEIKKFELNYFQSHNDTNYYLQVKQKGEPEKKIFLDGKIEAIHNFRFSIGVKSKKLNNSRLKIKIFQEKPNNELQKFGSFHLDLAEVIENNENSTSFQDIQALLLNKKCIGKVTYKITVNKFKLRNKVQSPRNLMNNIGFPAEDPLK